MCIHHYTYHVPCDHYIYNLDHTVNCHCTPVQESLFWYHDQHDAAINSNQPCPEGLPCPKTCPSNPPLQHLPNLTPRTASYVPQRALLTHPSPEAERRCYQGWGRFHSRNELDYFFFLASGLTPRPAGRYRQANLPAPPPPHTPAEEPTIQQLADRCKHTNPNDGCHNVQITPVPFGCGQGRSGPCRHGHRRFPTDPRSFFPAELDRAIEEEERIATNRAREDWLPDEHDRHLQEIRQNELVDVGGWRLVRRGDLRGFFKMVIAQGGDVIAHLRWMAEGGRGLVNGVMRRYGGWRRRHSCPEMGVGRAYGRGRSYSV